MRLIVTESQYNLLFEQGFEFPKTGNLKWDNPENFYAKQDKLKPQIQKLPDDVYFINLFEKKRPAMDNVLKRARNWWVKWLTNPNTKAKFQKLNNLLPDKTENIYQKYFQTINNTYLHFYYNGGKDRFVQAFVTSNDLKKINLNTYWWMLTDEVWLGLIIHEIQHLLYNVYPLTPNLTNIQFKSSDDCYRENSEIYNNIKLTYADKIKTLTEGNIENISRDLNFNIQLVPKFISPFLFFAYSGWKDGYLRGSPTELSSRIAATRLYFLGENINSDINLTKKHFRDYIINRTPQNSSDQVDYVLAHWVLRGFEPMEQFVNYLNTKFVKNDEKTDYHYV